MTGDSAVTYGRRLAVWVAMVLAIAACGGGGGGSGSGSGGGGGDDVGGGDVPRAETIYTQYAHPDDATMLVAETEDGERMTFYGEKDDRGIPTSFTALRFQTSEQVESGQATWVHFDQEGKLERFRAEDGSVIEFEQLSETEYLVTGLGPTGTVEASIVGDTADGTARASAKTVPGVGSGYSRLGQSPSAPRLAGLSDGASFRVEALVTQCNGQPAPEAEVFFSAGPVPVSGDFGVPVAHLSDTYLAQPFSNLRYSADIPSGNEPLDKDTVREACEASVGTITGASCSATGPLRSEGSASFCTTLGIAADWAAWGPTGEAVAISGACLAGFRAFDTYCTTVQSLPPGMPNDMADKPNEYICDSVAGAFMGHEGVRSVVEANVWEVQAFANVPGLGGEHSQPVVANPFTEEFPTFEIDYGGVISVREIAVSPSAPRVGEGYVATIQLGCSVGSVVTVEVIPSEGDTFRQEFSPGSDEPLVVSVPGGRQSDHDVIRVTAVAQGGGPFEFHTAQREKVVVFQEDGGSGDDPGGDDGDFDFSSVRQADFSTRLTYAGTFYPDEGSPYGSTRTVTIESDRELSAALAPMGCFPGQASDFGFVFSLTGSSGSERTFGTIGGLIAGEDCRSLPLAAVVKEVRDAASGETLQALDLQAIDLPVVEITAEAITFGVRGADACAAVDSVVYGEASATDSTGYYADIVQCDGQSRIEVTFHR